MQIVPKENDPLEQKQRLSKSILWTLQRNYFERQGIDAWRTGSVPHHITSSPFTADAYARIVFGFLRDCHTVGEQDGNSSVARLDVSQPLYVIELGSGPGRFAYLFLKNLLRVHRHSALKEIPVKYVMTDFTEQNLEYWRTHPWLRPFVEEGLLDFARFDVDCSEDLELLHSGDIIAAETLRNPLVVISNYLFDSIPQDAFCICEGRLFETLLTLTTPQKESDLYDPDVLSRLEMSSHNQLVDGDYYDEPEWNRILRDYERRLPGTSFFFPTAALQCVRNLQRLSGDRLLLLSGDRGYKSDEGLLQGKGTPMMAVHGSLSLMVDYQIIGEYCRHHGGQVLHPARDADNLNISAFMFGDLPQFCRDAAGLCRRD